MWQIQEHLGKFFHHVAEGQIQIYNEFSLQHEFGLYLRSVVANDVVLQFERPTSFFGIHTKLVKKEIDIALFRPDHTYKTAIELKYPRNGQHPEQMFKACQDIAFLEQLCSGGFDSGYFVMVADDPLFYSSGGVEGIYKHFRAGFPIGGQVQKPTGLKNEMVTISGSHHIFWQTIIGKRKFAVIQVQKML